MSTFAKARELVALRRSGASSAEIRTRADTIGFGGLHISGAAKVALGVGAAVATGGVLAGVTTLAATTRPKADREPNAPSAGDNPMLVPQTLSATGGSAGRSATPIVPSSSSGVLPGIIGIGLDYLSRRARGSSPATPLATPQCPQGSRDVFGRCVDLQPGGAVSGGGMNLTYGEAVNGQYGVALVPARMTLDTRRCPKGAVLGKDGLCYNKRNLRKDERMWNPGRKPLLTGGELNAMTIAARAAGKVKARQRQLQSMGLLPKPKSRRQIELELRYGGKLRGR